MRQTAAIFLDAYRELNSKKLFWIVLALSALLSGLFACFGISERGLTFLHWELNIGPNTMLMSKEYFYKHVVFINLGIKYGLTWVVTVLALVSTASIFPDFISGGSIDLVLSRPIGRLRLFITKYLAGLLFVGLQISVFTFACFLIIGLRGGAWEPRVFLAIPIVVCFFSYLYSMSVLLGLITRSAIAALLLTLLFWIICFGAYGSEFLTRRVHEFAAQRVVMLDKSIEKARVRVQELEKSNSTGTQAALDGGVRLPYAKSRVSDLDKKLTDAKRFEVRSLWVKRIAGWLYLVLPKMGETQYILERSLLTQADRDKIVGNLDDNDPIDIGDDPDAPVDAKKIEQKMIAEDLSRSGWRILGTSLLFELAILGMAARIFCRRDF